MEKYEEYGYNIQNGKIIIPECETEIKEGAFEDASIINVINRQIGAWNIINHYNSIRLSGLADTNKRQ